MKLMAVVNISSISNAPFESYNQHMEKRLRNSTGSSNWIPSKRTAAKNLHI